MKTKPVVPRVVALRDVEEAVDYYVAEASEQVALAFVDALDEAYAHLSRRPATGSVRYAHELELPGLRSWSLTRFPFLVFYVERADLIDVWRVLHAQRHIPSWLQETL